MHWPFKVIEKLQTEAFILNRIPTRIHTRTGAARGGEAIVSRRLFWCSRKLASSIHATIIIHGVSQLESCQDAPVS